MNETELYPVIEERRLPAVASRGMLRKRRRDLTDLPFFPPGTTLVFQAAGQFIVYDDRDYLSGSEEFVLNARAVAVVNLRPHTFVADVALPSIRHSECFTIRCTFTAVVVEAGEAARAGALDLPTELGYHLRKHRDLVAICAEHPTEHLAEVRINVEATVQSYYNVYPYKRPGLHVALQLVEVITPADLEERDRRSRTAEVEYMVHDRIQSLENRKRRQALADERVFASESDEFERQRVGERVQWEFQQEELRKEGERRLLAQQHRIEDMRMQRVRDYVAEDADGLMRLALAEGLISTIDYANLKRADEQDALQLIQNTITAALQGTNGDLVAMDIQILADKLMAKLAGPDAITRQRSSMEQRNLILGPRSGAADAFPPDESDFHG